MRTLVAAAACACHFWLLGGHLQTKHNVLVTTHTSASFATTVGVVGSIHPASSSTALKPDECPRAGRPHRVHFPSMRAVRREGGFGFPPHSTNPRQAPCPFLPGARGRPCRVEPANVKPVTKQIYHAMRARRRSTLYLLVLALEAAAAGSWCLPSLVSP